MFFSMETNRNQGGLGVGGAGYSTGRDALGDVRDQSRAESGPGRGAEGGGIQSGVRSAVRQGTEAAKDAAKDIGREVKEQARGIAQELGGSAREYVDQGRHRMTDQIGCISQALHHAADELEGGEGGARMANLTHSLAGRLEDVCSYVETAQPRDIVRKVEDFARREPVLFLGGCFVAGMIAARFLKASTRGDDREFDDWSRRRDSDGNLGTSSPVEDYSSNPLQGGLGSATGVGFPDAPLDTRPGMKPDIGPGLGGGV
jgi:hypothetical protein